MRLQKPESNGPAMVRGTSEGQYEHLKTQSLSLPFGQPIPLHQISGPTYLTAQTLVQQVAYSLSDRLWSYSPESFDLDVAVKSWFAEGTKNAHGYATQVESLQIRSGAASIALGYIFSKDYDLKKRHIPHSILTSSSSLQYLRSALDQLSLLYAVANPFVAHVAAIDYASGSSPGLVTDYVSALALAEELGLGLVSTFSAHESQHMSLFATLLANILPTLHVYDGVKVGQETTRVIDVLDKAGLHSNYKVIQDAFEKSNRKQDGSDRKVLNLLKAYNDELGTDYGLFEYEGYANPDSVLVVFGTVESSLASKVAQSLQKDCARLGVVNVRVYRPFVEEEFIRIMPKSTKTVGVLGQVRDRPAVSDSGIQSSLYTDVLAAFTFADSWLTPPAVIDIKYPREQSWTPVEIASAFQFLAPKPVLAQKGNNAPPSLQTLDLEVQQYTFWDLDDSPSAAVPVSLAQALAMDSSNNITVSTKYDNLLLGGVQRTDIRKSRRALNASYSINSADIVVAGDHGLLGKIDVLKSVKPGGIVILRILNFKDDELEKKLPANFRQALRDRGCTLYIIDPASIDVKGEDESWEPLLIQACFLRVAGHQMDHSSTQRTTEINGSQEMLESLSANPDNALHFVDIPETWAQASDEAEVPPLPADVRTTSLGAFDKSEQEPPTLLKDWQIIAKALAFKEAFGTEDSLRPDLSVQTYTITLAEHRRLTPATYDRNIMHLEFDLGNSGLQYNIGDSLGIHLRNDELDVQNFIKDYGLDLEAIVEAQSRDDPSILRASTVYQALVEQVDIFGRPSRQFYELLADFATSPSEQKTLLALGGPEGATEFKRRAEVDTITYADVLFEFPSAHPPFHDLIRLIAPLKRREYSIASCQKVTPTRVSLMIVTVLWTDPRGRDRFGLATRYLDSLRLGARVTVSLKPSVMKLPPNPTDAIIMAGLGTGLAPFRAFVQHRAWEKAQGVDIGPVLLFMGSRHQREEYCYGEEWEAYRDAGVITLLACAFSRDQKGKIYIQDRMREQAEGIEEAYLDGEAEGRKGAFYLCGPTWPVPDVTEVLEEVVRKRAERSGGMRKGWSARREIERLKEEGRFVLEVY